MTEEQLQHPITRETVEEATRRLMRIAVSPGRSAGRDLACSAALRFSVHSPTEAERLFYAAVYARLILEEQ